MYNEDGLTHIHGRAITPLKQVFYAVLQRQYFPLPWKKGRMISELKAEKKPALH
jgi:hypothetical protein